VIKVLITYKLGVNEGTKSMNIEETFKALEMMVLCYTIESACKSLIIIIIFYNYMVFVYIFKKSLYLSNPL
jgi:hypothetical protein